MDLRKNDLGPETQYLKVIVKEKKIDIDLQFFQLLLFRKKKDYKYRHAQLANVLNGWIWISELMAIK